jgi:hypothetical protein
MMMMFFILPVSPEGAEGSPRARFDSEAHAEEESKTTINPRLGMPGDS